MKTATRLAVCLSALVVLDAASALADYPIFYQRYTADPSGLEYNGRIYLYCSHDVFDPKNVGYIMKDFTLISSDDLKNWTDHGEVFAVPRDSAWGATLAWAPGVIVKNNKFYMYYGNGDKNIGVAISDSPTGPFKDTRSGPLVDRNTPGVGAAASGTYGMWIFDPGPFIDDDGQAYLYFGGGGVGNDRVIKLGSDMVSVVGAAAKLNIPGFFEGAFLHKYNGKYYFTCASHNYSTPACIDYSVSSSPMSGFQITGTVLPNPPNNAGNNNHASIFAYKDVWYIAYHNREVATQNGVTDATAIIYQRSVAIDRVTINADGTIKQVAITKNGLTQLKNVNPYVSNEAETMAQESGINTEACSDGGRDVTLINNGDWICVRGVDFGTGATSFEAKVASGGGGGSIEIRLGSLTGTLAGTCAIPATGGWQTWTTKTCIISGASGVKDLYFKFTGNGTENLFNFDSWKFGGGTPGTGGSGGSSGTASATGGRGGNTNSGGSTASQGGRSGGSTSRGGTTAEGGTRTIAGISAGASAAGGVSGGVRTTGGASNTSPSTPTGGVSSMAAGGNGVPESASSSVVAGSSGGSGSQAVASSGGATSPNSGVTEGSSGCSCSMTGRSGPTKGLFWLLGIGVAGSLVKRRRAG